jgi:TrmH RNA methyltransferase
MRDRVRRHEVRRTGPPPRTPIAPKKEGHDIVYGWHAALAVFVRRRQDIVRIAHGPSVRREVGDLSRWAASEGVPCVELGERELDRFADTTHHEGLCVITRPRPWVASSQFADLLASERGVAVALDRLRNPYNVGAILRSAAFFGLRGVLLGAPAPEPGLAATAVRVAEGGAEHLALSRTTDVADTLGRLRARGVLVVGADARAATSATGFRFRRPTLLVLGHEREGLSDRVRAQCDALVGVRGSGRIDSLNVAVAAGILMQLAVA